jgi:NADH-quinone oxidoreductase subunit L
MKICLPADVIDWRFWHDFVHDTVILGTYNWLSEIALDRYADQKGIDAFANWLGAATQWISENVRKVQMICTFVRAGWKVGVVILGYLF